MAPPLRYIFGIILIVLITSVVKAQDYIRFDQYSIRDGLSQSSVNCITQDENGFMWFGTQDGLNRFDGYNFTPFYNNPLDSSSISSNYINAILQDSSGTLIIATRKGVNFFNRDLQNFKRFLHVPGETNSLSEDDVMSLHYDSKGNLWMGTASGVLDVFNPNTNTVSHYKYSKNTSSHAIVAICEDANGGLLLGTDGGGLYRFNQQKLTFDEINTGDARVINHLFIDNENRVWVSSNSGLLCYTSSELNVAVNFQNNPNNPESVPLNEINFVFQDNGDALWCGTNGAGLCRMQLNGDKVAESTDIAFFQYRHHYELEYSLSDNIVHSMYEDRAGTMWIGTYDGISKFDPTKQYFVHYQSIPDNPNSLPSNSVWALLQDRNGTIWAGTRKGLTKINRGTNTFQTYQNVTTSSLFTNERNIISITQAQDNTIWLGTKIGVFRFNPTDDLPQFEHINYSDRYFDVEIENRVYHLFEDNQNNVWIGTKNGLGMLNGKTGEKRFFHYESGNENGLSGNTVRMTHQDKNGNLWVATTNGLNQIIFHSPDSIYFKSYQYEYGSTTSLSNNTVLSIWEDEKGFLWLGTYGGGLNKFNPESKIFTSYSEKDGLPNNVVYGILGDNDGALWLSSNKGISKFNPATETFQNFEENDGLQSNEFNTGAYFKNSFGELFFGGINGFNIFDPSSIRANTTPPNMVITSFTLFNEEVIPKPNSFLTRDISVTRSITLDYHQNNISFGFAALHFSFPEKNSYAYKMVGEDNDWNQVKDRRIAYYTNLDPGKYSFIVKGSNSDGVWSENAAKVDITITPPFWETWWFRISVLLLVGAAIFGVVMFRIELIRRQKRILEHLVEKRTGEVRTQKEQIEAQKVELEKEKEKAEQLLLNMLPEDTVDELKKKGKARARSYRTASVMFTDFKGFTKIAETLRPKELVTELDQYFIEFDNIIEQHDIEKIKTIGDAYMCVGGIPIRNKSNPIDIVLAALKIQKHVANVNQKKAESGQLPWELRLGIHTGDLTAGVIGTKRLAYDIWGDTVNTASRMENSSEVGKVNISEKTYSYIQNLFDCTKRGKIEVKNKGEIEMYFVDRIKPELSADEEGIEPNDMFMEYVTLELYSSINYQKAEKHIIARLEQELADDLYYHGIHHTRDVCHAVERLGKAEGIKGEQLFLLKTAALYHDAGFVNQYFNNEPIGAELAEEILPKFGYSQEQISLVSELIRATSVPQQPKTHLQEIICDADLDYLGRDDFHPISETLKKEFLANGVIQGDRSWDELQIKFLSSHQYFTSTAKRLRRDKKLKHLEDVKNRYEKGVYAS